MTLEQQSPVCRPTSDGWFDAADEAHVTQRRTAAARRRAYEDRVQRLWTDVKVSLAQSVTAYNESRDDVIQWGETPTGGFAATRFHRPLALMDVALDSDNGLMACVYTFATDDQAPYQESLRILLVTEHDTVMCLTTQEGRRLGTSDDAALDLLTPFVARLTCDETRSVE
jgi:hypothetical protein